MLTMPSFIVGLSNYGLLSINWLTSAIVLREKLWVGHYSLFIRDILHDTFLVKTTAILIAKFNSNNSIIWPLQSVKI
ncbi:hypothetical protein VIAE109791_06970 [Vibrio aestuarianus subsp. francensis]